MKKSYRVKSDKDFKAIFGRGTSVANRQFVVYQLAKPQAHYRLGLSVSKKLGNAVTRNRIKRKLRHIVMELGPQLKSNDFVLIARKGVEELDYQQMKRNVSHVLKLAKLYEEGLDSEQKD